MLNHVFVEQKDDDYVGGIWSDDDKATIPKKEITVPRQLPASKEDASMNNAEDISTAEKQPAVKDSTVGPEGESDDVDDELKIGAPPQKKPFIFNIKIPKAEEVKAATNPLQRLKGEGKKKKKKHKKKKDKVCFGI